MCLLSARRLRLVVRFELSEPASQGWNKLSFRPNRCTLRSKIASFLAAGNLCPPSGGSLLDGKMQADLKKSRDLCPTCLNFERHGHEFQTKYSEVGISAERGCTQCKWIAAALYMQAYCELVVLDTLVVVMPMVDRRVEIREVNDSKRYEDLVRLEIYTPVGMLITSFFGDCAKRMPGGLES
jgi:hypothetical protein